ncbi:RHS repeat-associated core domain-containing protein [Paenibacillus durus]|uniref:Lysozyme n=1 Tax=Paenibacillus durus ATCC 35681 TaxID=1333534 RepID=A0A0F7F8E6_PAEDU|nr:RHS repeat-associated core domain-containing protein [Paenibacillus durus]AKG34398.1 hypothetical protein VK70_07270 [Paenibacillus durus ATCC 35681]
MLDSSKRTPLELLKWRQQGKLTWEEIQRELEKELTVKGEEASVQDSVYGEKEESLSLHQRQTVTSQVYNEEPSTTNQLEMAASMNTAFDMTVASVLEGAVREAQINQTNKPQFEDRSATNETVDPVSGSLTWKKNMIHLPGRDGLDLDIGLMYNSNEVYPFRREYNDWSGYHTRGSYSRLGTGWSFQFPSVQSFGDYQYYNNGKGSVYRTERYWGGWDPLVQYTKLVNYKGKDMQFVYDDSHVFSNGQKSSDYYMEYADQKREYFSYNGLLLGIVDRFGNTITFKYEIQTMYDGYQPELLTSITDTLGREVTFTYENTLNMPEPFTGENVYIRVYEGGNEVQKVTLTKGRVQTTVNELQTYVPRLWSITDQAGETTYFDYRYEFARYNPHSLYYGEQDYNYYSLLKKVMYPNSTTDYEYNGAIRHIGYYETVEEFQVSSRSDHTGTKAYNQIGYSYIGNYTGENLWDYPELPESYHYSSTATLQSDTSTNGQRTTRTFDGKGRLISTDTQAANGERQVVTNTAFHDLFLYSPTRTTISDYGAGDSEATANHLYTETSYTDWGLVGTQTEPLTGDQFNNPNIKQHYTTTLTYEPNYRMLESKSWYQKETDASPLTERYTYTGEGRLSTFTNAKNEQTSYTYGYINGLKQIHQVTAETRADNKLAAKTVTNYGADYQYAYPTEQQQWFNIGTAEQKIVKKTMAYDRGTGRLIRESDGNNQSVSYEYDPVGRLKKETHPVRSNQNGESYSEVVEYNYYHMTSGNFDAVNAGTPVLKVDSIKTVTQLSNGYTVKTYANTLYNGMGLALLEEHWDENAGKWIFTQYHYDDLGRPVYQKDGLGNEITVGYDAWGRQNRATDTYGNVYVTDHDLKQRKSTDYMVAADTQEKLNYLETAYDPRGRVISKRTYKDWPSQSQPIAESYQYDISGNVIGYTDPMNHRNDGGVTTAYSYDALNRLIAVQDALNQTTRYSYDGNGQLSKVTVQAKGGAEQTLNSKNYNEIGLLASKQDGASRSESLSYNTLGQLTGRTDRNGTVFGYSYDESGQLKTSTVSGTINNAPQTQEIQTIFGDGSPRYQSIKTYINGAEKATQRLQLDSLGQVRNNYSIAYSSNGSGNHSAYILNQRDALGRITQLNDNYLNFYVNYQYNKQRLDKVQTNGSSAVNGDASANVQYSYYANDLVKSITYPPLTDGSILKTEYTYNKALGWTETVRNTKGGSVLSSYSYSYDDNGNITAVSEVRNDGVAQTTSYGYDALNRLVSITRPDGGSTTYTYDVRGNRLTMSDTVSTSMDLADTSYSYDLLNTLTSVTKDGSTTSFQYYADGLRYLKSTGNTHTQVNYDFNGQVITEEKLNGGSIVEQSTFVRGDRVLVKKDKTAGKDYYYLYNGHGDVVQIVDTSGNPVNSYAYDAWGNITSQTEGTSNSFKYAGEVYDAETGLYYLRARYYDPSIGRFLNEDTYEGQIDNPLSQNLYTYVENNPLIYTDPTGHYTFKDDPSQPAVVQGYVVSTDMHASDKLVEFLKTYETFSAQWYYATKEEKERNIKTIGYGHVIQPGEEKLLKGITEEQALSLLKSDIQNKAENYINDWADRNGIVFTQQQFDALVSWKFNGGDFLNRDPGKMLKEGDFSSSEFQNEFKNEMLLWVKGSGKKLPGLYMRRYDEWEMFVNGDYTRNYNRVLPKGF